MDSQHMGFYAFSFFTSLRSSPSGFADKIVWSVSLFAKVSSAKLVVLRNPCKSRDRSTLFLGLLA